MIESFRVVAAGGSTRTDGLIIEFGVSWLVARENEPDRIDTSFVQQDVEFEGSALHPRPVNEDLGASYLEKVGRDFGRTSDETVAARVDFTAPLGGATGLREIRAGLKVRRKSRHYDGNVVVFEPEDDIGLLDHVDTPEDRDRFLGGRYDLGATVSGALAAELLATDELSGRRVPEEDGGDYHATEDTLAVHAGTWLGAGPRVEITPGFRVESTESRYSGLVIRPGEDDDEFVVAGSTGTVTETFLLPMLGVRYTAATTVEVHAGLTRSIARPNYYDLVPYSVTELEDREIELGNPDLRTTTSWNADARVVWTPAPGGSIDAAVFHKSLTDFIYVSREVREIDSVPFLFFQSQNGPRATLRGLELTGAYRFTDDGWSGGFRFLGHLGYTDSDAVIARGDDTRVPLPGQAAWVGKAEVGYDRGRIRLGVAFGYVGAYLHEIGTAADGDVRVASRRRIDASVGFQVFPGAVVTLSALNLTDAPVRRFRGSGALPVFEERTGRAVRIGFRFEF